MIKIKIEDLRGKQMLYHLLRPTWAVCLLLLVIAPAVAGQRTKVVITSSHDGAQQPCYVVLPNDHDQAKSAPLLVSLHSWSADLEQRKPLLEKLAGQRGWICLFPNFRGANDDPLACGSLGRAARHPGRSGPGPRNITRSTHFAFT